MSDPAVLLPPPSAPRSTARVPPPSSHRLATVSASEALLNIQARGPRSISTGLSQLDALLGTANPGLGRANITEIWGPSGSGKTSLASRLDHFLAANLDASEPDHDTRLDRFHAYSTPTLAHLLALTLHPPQSFPPPGTALMVIDDLHAIFEVSYPRNRANTFSSHKSEAARWAAGRRYGIMGTLISALKKLAALNDMAIIVTTGCATRVRPASGLGAVLVPGMGGAEWEAGISNRLVMFRDFRLGSWAQQQQNPESARYIGLQKNSGVAFSDEGETGQVVPFSIDKDGLKDVVNKDSTADAPVVTLAASSPSKVRKRPYSEIADGTAEGRDEYGWLNGDEADAEGLIDEAALLEDDEDAAIAVPDEENPATIVIDD
ncbi:P-loop containing nucleoside triphosphate hydrolase protein [Aureobasidium sp. EXF-10728]|nr:P-loop containing nucleoside triphosphate hydrolase protein [Aureobasidium sp. EXF-10728]